MAIGGRADLVGMIHHSDRRIQYCSNVYTSKLKQSGMEISMSQQANPYKNAVAERINGILKMEFMLGGIFIDYGIASEAVKEAVESFNGKKPHMSLGYRTPDEVYYYGRV